MRLKLAVVAAITQHKLWDFRAVDTQKRSVDRGPQNLKSMNRVVIS